MQDKITYNEQGQKHGNWEVLDYSDFTLGYKGYYINGDRYGYWEWPNINVKQYYAR